MTTIGILHGGSRKAGQPETDKITGWLNEHCKKPLTIKVADWDDNLSARAKSLMTVAVLLVLGGSRNAQIAIQHRGSAKTPIIVFTNVAEYVVHGVDLSITTGVCARTSDDEGTRLDYLLDFLGTINQQLVCSGTLAVVTLRLSGKP